MLPFLLLLSAVGLSASTSSITSINGRTPDSCASALVPAPGSQGGSNCATSTELPASISLFIALESTGTVSVEGTNLPNGFLLGLGTATDCSVAQNTSLLAVESLNSTSGQFSYSNTLTTSALEVGEPVQLCWSGEGFTDRWAYTGLLWDVVFPCDTDSACSSNAQGKTKCCANTQGLGQCVASTSSCCGRAEVTSGLSCCDTALETVGTTVGLTSYTVDPFVLTGLDFPITFKGCGLSTSNQYGFIPTGQACSGTTAFGFSNTMTGVTSSITVNASALATPGGYDVCYQSTGTGLSAASGAGFSVTGTTGTNQTTDIDPMLWGFGIQVDGTGLKSSDRFLVIPSTDSCPVGDLGPAGNDISGSVNSDGTVATFTVNTFLPGDYNLCYEYSDTAGRIGTANILRGITLTVTEVPAITLVRQPKFIVRGQLVEVYFCVEATFVEFPLATGTIAFESATADPLVVNTLSYASTQQFPSIFQGITLAPGTMSGCGRTSVSATEGTCYTFKNTTALNVASNKASLGSTATEASGSDFCIQGTVPPTLTGTSISETVLVLLANPTVTMDVSLIVDISKLSGASSGDIVIEGRMKGPNNGQKTFFYPSTGATNITVNTTHTNITIPITFSVVEAPGFYSVDFVQLKTAIGATANYDSSQLTAINTTSLELLFCTGIDENCQAIICPTCKNGVCGLLADGTQTCTCNANFQGAECDTCISLFTGSNCDEPVTTTGALTVAMGEDVTFPDGATFSSSQEISFMGMNALTSDGTAIFQGDSTFQGEIQFLGEGDFVFSTVTLSNPTTFSLPRPSTLIRMAKATINHNWTIMGNGTLSLSGSSSFQANENGQGNCNGVVRYGATVDGIAYYSYRPTSGAYSCTNDFFGDSIPGSAKSCVCFTELLSVPSPSTVQINTPVSLRNAPLYIENGTVLLTGRSEILGPAILNGAKSLLNLNGSSNTTSYSVEVIYLQAGAAAEINEGIVTLGDVSIIDDPLEGSEALRIRGGQVYVTDKELECTTFLGRPSASDDTTKRKWSLQQFEEEAETVVAGTLVLSGAAVSTINILRGGNLSLNANPESRSFLGGDLLMEEGGTLHFFNGFKRRFNSNSSSSGYVPWNALGVAGGCGTYNASGNVSGTPIPDNNPNGVAFVLELPPGEAESLVARVAVRHTYISDLRVTLTSPDGTTITLWSKPNIATDDFDLTFDDNANQTLAQITTYSDVVVQPFNAFSSIPAFQPQGNWIFRIIDTASSDVGTVELIELRRCTPTAAVQYAGALSVHFENTTAIEDGDEFTLLTHNDGEVSGGFDVTYSNLGNDYAIIPEYDSESLRIRVDFILASDTPTATEIPLPGPPRGYDDESLYIVGLAFGIFSLFLLTFIGTCFLGRIYGDVDEEVTARLKLASGQYSTQMNLDQVPLKYAEQVADDDFGTLPIPRRPASMGPAPPGEYDERAIIVDIPQATWGGDSPIGSPVNSPRRNSRATPSRATPNRRGRPGSRSRSRTPEEARQSSPRPQSPTEASSTQALQELSARNRERNRNSGRMPESSVERASLGGYTSDTRMPTPTRTPRGQTEPTRRSSSPGTSPRPTRLSEPVAASSPTVEEAQERRRSGTPQPAAPEASTRTASRRGLRSSSRRNRPAGRPRFTNLEAADGDA